MSEFMNENYGAPEIPNPEMPNKRWEESDAFFWKSLRYVGGTIFLSLAGIITISVILSIPFGLGWTYRTYHVWSSGKAGQAELAKADYNRKILVREAEAKKDSSKFLAQADVIRAKGIAEANKIIGDSLKTNEKYLEWKFIDELPQNKNQIIYLPTNTVLPILEAARGKAGG